LVFSGGTLSLSSGLTRLDIFEPSDHTEWQSSPLVLSLSQPLFGYNDLKQARVNAANQLSIADLEYVFESFSFKRKIANLVLQYYLVAKQLELTESRLARMDTTLLLAKERLRLGKTPRSDIDALTINKLKLEEEYERHKANLDDLILKFREHEISPFVIDDLNSWNIPSYDLAEIQSTAVKRNPTFRKNAVRLFEANEQITKNKRDAGPGATINVAFGYNQRADRFDDVYNNVLGSQRMSIGVSVPLYDGGASRYQQLIDNHRLKGIEQTAFADSLALMQKIRSEHMAYELLLKNRTSSLTILELTKNRLNDYSEMHGLGKISVDQYLLAENEYAQRELEYYSVMVNLWRKVFTIRALCVTE
ncbi:MAG: TolC family protein, partial [Bacteroidia bacterium]|nr:TolC family protein [Bacteroidia bacterium]